MTSGPVTPIRSLTLPSGINNLTSTNYPNTTLFTEDDFNNVSQQLNSEFGYVSLVYKFHDRTQALFTSQNTNSQNVLKSIAQTVIDTTKTPPGSPVVIDALRVLEVCRRLSARSS